MKSRNGAPHSWEQEMESEGNHWSNKEEIQFLLIPHMCVIGTDPCNKRQVNKKNTGELIKSNTMSYEKESSVTQSSYPDL